MAQSSEIKLLKRFDQDVEITGNLTLGGNAIGINTDNFYLDGITKSGNTLTFSVNGATNQSYTFGSAAFADTTAFAAASHGHSANDLTSGTLQGSFGVTGNISGYWIYLDKASNNNGIHIYAASGGKLNWDARDFSINSDTGARIHKWNRNVADTLYLPYYENWYDGNSYHTIGVENNQFYIDGSPIVTSANIASYFPAGMNFTDPVTIYDGDAGENPRLSLGRSSSQRIKFYVDDRTAIMSHEQDEGSGEHALWFTVDSPTPLEGKVFNWQARAANGSSSTTLMTLNSTGLSVGNLLPTAKLTFPNVVDTNGYDVGTMRFYQNGSDIIYGIGISSGQFNLRAGNSDDGFAFWSGTTNRLKISGTSGNVGINDPSPSYKLDVNGTARIQGYNSLTIHGVELKGYANNNLWMISNNSGESRFIVSTSWDWDRQVEFRYNPGTIGTPDGTLSIGQMEKNSATWTHGNTHFYTNGTNRLSIDSDGIVTINPSAVSAKKFRVYYDMDVYNTVNLTSAAWGREGFIQSTGGNGVRIGNDTGAVYWDFNGSNGYFYAFNWIKIGGGAGIFSDTNGAHFYPNTYSSYGTWRMNGSRGGYGGLLLRDVANKPHIMYDGSGNGGLYNEANGVWPVYYHVGNNSVGIGGSATLAGYNAYVNGNARATGEIVANASLVTAQPTYSGYFGAASFSWQGNTAFPTLYSSNAQRWVMICNPHVPYLESGTNGFTGSTAGSSIGFASNAAASTVYWGLGINPQGIGAQDLFSITRNNTTRLLDITSAGNMQITGGFGNSGARRILFPAGGSLEGPSNTTGAIKIGLPTARYGSNTMMTFKVVIYEYSTGETYEYRIGGYNYSDHAWRNVSCIQISDQAPRHTVRWGNDGSRECVWIGETNTGWSYPQVEVMDVTCGFSGESLDGWADGWSLSFVSSFNTVTQTRTPARLGYNINAATVRLDSGTDYPIDVTSNQRYQIGMRYLGIGESSYYPYLAHDYGSQVDQTNQSQFIIHFNGIGDKFRFNRSGYFEADGSVVTKNWFRVSGGGGLYFQSLGYGFRSANDGGMSYGHLATYNTGKSGWSGYGIHHSNTAFMGSASGDVGIYNASQGDWAFYYIPTNRGVGLMTSTTSSTYEVYVGGDLYATGDIVAYSDRRVKENIINIDSALNKVKALQGVYYNRINDKDKVREIGFIAQDVHDAVPELASYAEDIDEWGVKYSQVTGLHNEAIKELAQELDKKDEQIANLRAQIDELKQLILNK